MTNISKPLNMKTITKRKTVTLLCLGLFVIALSQILYHYIQSTDFIQGTAIGIGIGLLSMALIFGNLKTAKHN